MDVSPEEENDANYALVACLHTAAQRLDDRRSDASAVALGLRPACAGEFARFRQIAGRNLNPAARQIFRRNDDQSFMQIATMIVLEERAKGR
jgi:hypothetical protein